MEILNILYDNNLIAVYLIGAILLVILIFIVISSINTTPKEEKILKDPTKEEKEEPEKPTIVEEEKIKEEKIETNIEKKDIVKDSDEPIILEETPSLKIEENRVENKEEKEEIEEISKTEIDPVTESEPIIDNPEFVEEIETPRLKDKYENTENVEEMLKRLYDLRQNEKEDKKRAILMEIIDLKKQLDEALKANNCDYELTHDPVNNKELADYYLYNKDIEFPKLK